MTISDYKNILDDLEEIMRRAGLTVMRQFRKKISPRTKKNDTPVSQADIESERIILNGLKKYGFPVVSEEDKSVKQKKVSDVFWLVDPLDGTENFLRGDTDFCIMVGLVKNGEPVLGAIYMPSTRSFYFAAKDCGAYIKEYLSGFSIRKLCVKNSKYLTMVVSKHHLSNSENKTVCLSFVNQIIPRGSVGVKACIIARGEAQIYMKQSLKMGYWDICAPEIIVREAGGIVTDFQNRRIKYSTVAIKPENFLMSSCDEVQSYILSNLKK